MLGTDVSAHLAEGTASGTQAETTAGVALTRNADDLLAARAGVYGCHRPGYDADAIFSDRILDGHATIPFLNGQSQPDGGFQRASTIHFIEVARYDDREAPSVPCGRCAPRHRDARLDGSRPSVDVHRRSRTERRRGRALPPKSLRDFDNSSSTISATDIALFACAPIIPARIGVDRTYSSVRSRRAKSQESCSSR